MESLWESTEAQRCAGRCPCEILMMHTAACISSVYWFDVLPRCSSHDHALEEFFAILAASRNLWGEFWQQFVSIGQRL